MLVTSQQVIVFVILAAHVKFPHQDNEICDCDEFSKFCQTPLFLNNIQKLMSFDVT